MLKRASILCIGTEITTGKILDTNSQYLAKKLFLLGVEISGIIKLPDNLFHIKKSLFDSLKNNDLIIISGGLGPTQDDITKGAVKDVLKLKTEFSKKIYAQIEERFRKRGYIITDNNRSQAVIFKNAVTLQNDFGTAPGFLIKKNNKIVILLPGPPFELIPMFEKKVIPILKKKIKVKLLHLVYRFYGLGESNVADRLAEIDREIRALKGGLTYLSAPGFIDIIILARFNIKKIKVLGEKIQNIFCNNLYSKKWESMADVVSGLLLKKRLTLSIAESCTGGLTAKTLTDIPGSSNYFKFGIVCYSNESKTKLLNVKKTTLMKYGAVSRETAEEMLNGLNYIIKTDISISITGIAGPSGGTKEKPIGLVYIGLRFKDISEVLRYNFIGNRERIRTFTLNKVLEMIYNKIL